MNLTWIHDPLLLAVNMLAVFRVTRLITRDSLPPMVWVRQTVAKLNTNRVTEHPLLALIECDWCVTVWVTAGEMLLMTFVPGWVWVATGLAVAAVAGLLSAVRANDE